MHVKVLITGGQGMLASALAAELSHRGHAIRAPHKDQLNVLRHDHLELAIRRLRPAVIAWCAAYTRVDDAEQDADAAFAINAAAVGVAAQLANETGARLVYPGSDYVFDGAAREPYPPDAPTNPISVYGRSKLAGEQNAMRANDHLIVRTSWLYGAGGRNFVRTVSDRLRQGEPLRVVNDQTGSLTWTRDAAAAIVALLEQDAPRGIYHVTNAGSGTWYDVACEIARLLKLDAAVITPCATADFPTPARRPAYSVLDNAKTDAIAGPRRYWRAALADALAADDY